MIIFIRACEQSLLNYGNLSNQGLVRRNNLPLFLKRKYINKINTPELIITKKHEIHSKLNNKIYNQTVIMISNEFKINIEEYDSIDNIISSIEKNIEKDILICLEYDDIVIIIEKLIKKLYKSNIKLKWNKDPLAKNHDPTDFVSIWVLDIIHYKLYIYQSFNVIYNSLYYRYDIDYTCTSNIPTYTLNLSFSYFNWLKSFVF